MACQRLLFFNVKRKTSVCVFACLCFTESVSVRKFFFKKKQTQAQAETDFFFNLQV